MKTPNHSCCQPWDQQIGESDAAFNRFLNFRDQGPGRRQMVTARCFGVSGPTIHGQCKRYDWVARAQAWDQRHFIAADACSGPSSESRPEHASFVDAVRPTDEEGQHERAYLEQLEIFRSTTEAIGRDQLRAARAMTALVGRSISLMIKQGTVLRPRDIPSYLNAACTLAAAGQNSWGRALGVDALLSKIEHVVIDTDPADVDPKN